MTTSAPTSTLRASPWWTLAFAGFYGISWQIVALILAINSGYAAMMSIEDTRPFWHPFITTQCFGLAIAYFVNAASPWYKTRPVLRLACAVAIGTAVGYFLVFFVKGTIIGEPGYRFVDMFSDTHKAWTLLSGFGNGLFVSLFFLIQFREARSRAELLRAEADRNLLSKQAIEAELKLMQAQVEPHFLFNTLASVQFLTETNPQQASALLGHLIDYLRAALPQLRASSTTLGKETDLVEAYLNILKTRIGGRMTFQIDIPPELKAHPFPPNLLISLVENAIKHGIEPAASGGTVTVSARRDGESIIVSVSDTGRGLVADPVSSGQGVGRSNVRARLAALYGPRAPFTVESLVP